VITAPIAERVDSSVFKFADGHWQSTLTLQIGTILSNGCGTQGTVYRTPFVATRTGDVAPSVIVADPALFEAPTR
jgi:hypothetical protein